MRRAVVAAPACAECEQQGEDRKQAQSQTQTGSVRPHLRRNHRLFGPALVRCGASRLSPEPEQSNRARFRPDAALELRRYLICVSLAVPIMRIARRSISALWRRMSYHIETSSGFTLPTVSGAKHVQTLTP